MNLSVSGNRGFAADRVVAKSLLASACLLLATALGLPRSACATGEAPPNLGWTGPAFALAPADQGPRDLLAAMTGLGPALAPDRGARQALLDVAPRISRLPPLAGQADLAEAVVLTSPIPSGLTWRSGASCSEGFAGWRGRAVDVNVVFIGHDTWDAMYKRFRGGFFRGRLKMSPQNVVSIPLMPRSERKQHAACAAGKFDSTFREFGQLLGAAGGGRAVVRLGWEANVGSGSHPWGIDTAEDIPSYKACFQRLARALKSTAPGIQIEWTNAKKGKLPVSVMEAYPGDDAVDAFGVHYYDSGPAMTTQALWDERFDARHNSGPLGINQWLNEAKAHGMRLGVPEWGLGEPGGARSADNKVYVENMFDFFRTNAASLTYENYYNCPEKHKIYPPMHFPKAGDRYRELWSRGF